MTSGQIVVCRSSLVTCNILTKVAFPVQRRTDRRNHRRQRRLRRVARLPGHHEASALRLRRVAGLQAVIVFCALAWW